VSCKSGTIAIQAAQKIKNGDFDQIPYPIRVDLPNLVDLWGSNAVSSERRKWNRFERETTYGALSRKFQPVIDAGHSAVKTRRYQRTRIYRIRNQFASCRHKIRDGSLGYNSMIVLQGGKDALEEIAQRMHPDLGHYPRGASGYGHVGTGFCWIPATL